MSDLDLDRLVVGLSGDSSPVEAVGFVEPPRAALSKGTIDGHHQFPEHCGPPVVRAPALTLNFLSGRFDGSV